MKNIEIEAKYKINSEIYDDMLKYLTSKNYVEKQEKQHDIYFSPINFPFFGGTIDNECLRIRVLNDKNILSYKKFVAKTEDKSSYCIEHEIEVEDIEGLKRILEDLRIEETITIKKLRRSFNIENLLELSLDDVVDLGKFVELEIKNEEELEKSLQIMKEITSKFSLTEEMRDYDGYSYLLYENFKNK